MPGRRRIGTASFSRSGSKLGAELEGSRIRAARELTGAVPARAARERIAAQVRIGALIARALHAAHQIAVIHRDVKPGNGMITPAGEALAGVALVQVQHQDGAAALDALSANAGLVERHAALQRVLTHVLRQKFLRNPGSRRSHPPPFTANAEGCPVARLRLLLAENAHDPPSAVHRVDSGCPPLSDRMCLVVATGAPGGRSGALRDAPKLPIPPDASRHGGVMHAQAFVVDPRGASRFSRASAVRRLVIGDRARAGPRLDLSRCMLPGRFS